MGITLTGSCLCGSVNYKTDAEPQVVGHCHCIDCRKTSGTGHGTHVGLPEETVTLTGELKFYDHPADSGTIISRGFCPACGSAIFSRNSNMEGMAFLRASSLDNPDAITPQVVVYTARAPKWDVVDPDLPSFPGMPEGGAQRIIDENAS